MKLEITKFDHFGRGIAYNKEKIIFVNKALPDEIVDVKIIQDKKKYSVGDITSIDKKSSERVTPICPYYDKCGGCSLLHMSYDMEKEFKINKAKEVLGRCDAFYETSNLNYRNKVTLHVLDGQIGLFEEKSNSIISINYCYLLNENINKVIKDLQDVKLKGIKKIIVKSHMNKTLVDFDNKVESDILRKLDYVDTIICHNKVIKGNGYLEEVIDNKVFKITSNAFFQVNKDGLENINKIIKSYLINKKINKALDLYSGTSLWGILISDLAKEVTSIEINQEACLKAKENILKNSVKNIEVINGKVEDYLNGFKNIDLVIVDPPRSGLDKKTIDYLRKINAKYFIYISCDMLTLKRDLKELKTIYDVKKIELVDMFKGTYHCECVCLLKLK